MTRSCACSSGRERRELMRCLKSGAPRPPRRRGESSPRLARRRGSPLCVAIRFKGDGRTRTGGAVFAAPSRLPLGWPLYAGGRTPVQGQTKTARAGLGPARRAPRAAACKSARPQTGPPRPGANPSTHCLGSLARSRARAAPRHAMQTWGRCGPRRWRQRPRVLCAASDTPFFAFLAGHCDRGTRTRSHGTTPPMSQH